MTEGTARRVAIPLRFAREHVAPLTGGEIVRLHGNTMGTSWSVAAVAARGTDAGQLNTIITEALDLVIAQMSPWQPCSDISRFNAATAGTKLALPAEFRHVLQCALRVAAETNGAYDPTLGALVDLWGFGPRPAATLPPAQTDIDAALHACGWRQLVLTPDGSVCQPGGLRLDLSSIAKGFAVDLVAARLHAHGFSHALVEIGGELAGSGVKPDGTPWWVGIEHRGSNPAPASGIVVALHGMAIATSGVERAVTVGGRRHAHTIDPKTGAPVEGGLVRATVLASSCMEADAYATAFMVMGVERSLAFAITHHIAALLIDETGREHVSPRLAAMLE